MYAAVNTTQSAWLTWDAAQHMLTVGGDWTYHSLQPLVARLSAIVSQIQGTLIIDMQQVLQLDTSGGWLLAHFFKKIVGLQHTYHIRGCQSRHQQLLHLVNKHMKATLSPTIQNPASVNALSLFTRLGEITATKTQVALAFLAFIGELCSRCFTLVRYPSYFRGRYLANIMQQCAIMAVPLIAFLSLLVGVVLTYQLGLQLRLYGANVFVVNLLSMSVLHEFGSLITAILVAGRSGSAFTAQIATMMLRQEVDALRTLGLSPMDYLIIPRVLALMIMMPLLTVWAECFALLGGILMSKSMLGIGFYEFLQRARIDISLDTYFIGLIKTPVFGFVIATVGCFQGLQGSGSAASVGQQTTKSVVQALFLIIILDAFFSVIFSMHGF